MPSAVACFSRCPECWEVMASSELCTKRVQLSHSSAHGRLKARPFGSKMKGFGRPRRLKRAVPRDMMGGPERIITAVEYLVDFLLAGGGPFLSKQRPVRPQSRPAGALWQQLELALALAWPGPWKGIPSAHPRPCYTIFLQLSRGLELPRPFRKAIVLCP